VKQCFLREGIVYHPGPQEDCITFIFAMFLDVYLSRLLRKHSYATYRINANFTFYQTCLNDGTFRLYTSLCL